MSARYNCVAFRCHWRGASYHPTLTHIPGIFHMGTDLSSTHQRMFTARDLYNRPMTVYTESRGTPRRLTKRTWKDAGNV